MEALRSDKDPGSPNQQRGLMKVRQFKFGKDYSNISKSERYGITEWSTFPFEASNAQAAFKLKIANDVQTQREIKNDYMRLVDYLKCNYTGEESIAAARHKLSSLRISRSVDLINVGNEIARLIDMIYVEEFHKDRLRRKKQRLAELLPVEIIRSLIKHDRPLCEPFDHTILVAKNY
uniref:Uncharacterized protein n=1 Tax=Strongyloides venezuelensis TaxID=75913 RepID=A0A0K0FGW4_STRVS